jgi:hypothetical protein
MLPGGHRMFEEVKECCKRNKLNSVDQLLDQEDQPPQREIEFLEGRAGSLLFFRADIPHRHLRMECHSCVIHFDFRFRECPLNYDGEGSEKLGACETFVKDDKTKTVALPESIKDAIYYDNSLTYAL